MADHLLPGGTGVPRDWTDAELERALRDLGRNVAFPPTPDLARSVRVRLATRSAMAERAARAPGRREAIVAWLTELSPRRAVAVAALAILLASAAMLALVPDARDTVAGWFGVRGIRIVVVEDTPTPAPSATVTPSPATPAASPTAAPLGSSLLLGERVTLAEAQARVAFPIRLPDASLLGPPDEVYLRQRTDGAMVSFIYYPRPTLPAAAETGVGLLLVQFAAPEGTFWMEKGVAPANEIDIVEVAGQDGLWLGGSHYLMIAPDPALGAGAGAPRVRMAANVLLWDEDGVTYRLESALSRPQAVNLAASLRPMATPGPATPDP